MESLPIPKTIKVYQLIKMNTKTGLNFSSVGNPGAGAAYLGIGFFNTMSEAEQNRTLETLKELSTHENKFFVFELEFPNPIYKE